MLAFDGKKIEEDCSEVSKFNTVRSMCDMTYNYKLREYLYFVNFLALTNVQTKHFHRHKLNVVGELNIK